MRSTTIFWDEDTQVDFMRPEGKLYVPGAESIIPKLAQLTEWARAHRVLVVGSVDAHTPSDPEFQQYPPHCLAGTPGQKKIPETQLTAELIIPNRPVQLPENMDDYDQIILEKQTVDVFTNPNTEALLAWLGKERPVVLYGVFTDVCVAHAARGLLDRGHKVTLVTDAIYPIDPAKGQALIEEVVRRGGRLVTTDEIVRRRVAA
jgi:nicotinamidase/pyrazinamidase